MRNSGVTWRSLFIGALLIPPNAYWIVQLELVWGGTYPSVITLLFNVVFSLFVVIGLNLFFGRFFPDKALSYGEVLTIYIMMAVGIALCGCDVMQTLDGVTDTMKIDSAATDGLTGVSNSLAYRVHEIERHLHSGGRWFETAAAANPTTHVADRIGDGAGAFQIDAGNNTWGDWVQILGSSDTPTVAGKTHFDPHQFIVEAAEKAATYFIQMGRGASGAAALAAGTYTEFVYSATVQKDTSIIPIQTGRAPAGSLLWVRCVAPGENTATLDFYIGLHEYEG